MQNDAKTPEKWLKPWHMGTRVLARISKMPVQNSNSGISARPDFATILHLIVYYVIKANLQVSQRRKKSDQVKKGPPYPLARQCASDTLWPASGFLSLYWLPAYLSILLLCKNTWTMVSPQLIKSNQSNRNVILEYWKDERMRWKKECALKTNNWSYYAREKEK